MAYVRKTMHICTRNTYINTLSLVVAMVMVMMVMVVVVVSTSCFVGTGMRWLELLYPGVGCGQFSSSTQAF